MLSPTRVLRKGWASTLKLPKSQFPPRPVPEDQSRYLKRCTDDFYSWQSSTDRPTFVLHDGPPYANGKLHIGHALNKILKDFICRFQVLQGNKVRYVPGWDCHGLPIETKALQQNSDLREALADGAHPSDHAVAIRAMARELAAETVEEQKAGFKSWAVMGDWDNAWSTMDKDFELRQLEMFQKMFEKGLIYREFKPVYWSPSSRTALAEAEIEYDENHISQTAHICFPLTGVDYSALSIPKGSRVSALIWTTTPWTLPANRAIAVNKNFEYVLVEIPDYMQKHYLLVAESRLAEVVDAHGSLTGPRIVQRFSGSELADKFSYINPLQGDKAKPQPLVHADFVTDQSGTGLVHMAPGHGMDDFDVCRRHSISPDCPVDTEGRFTNEACPIAPEAFKGLAVQGKGSDTVLGFLAYLGEEHPNLYVFAQGKIQHKYPIDWRTKKPVIIRATFQWFANVEAIKSEALAAIEQMKFTPESGRNRLSSFIKARSHWCISRQRSWGVPIPALYRKDHDKAIMDSKTIGHIIQVIKERGIDAWWSDPPNEPAWIPPHLEGDYVRGIDTMDVWFDSGSSWSLLDQHADTSYRADVGLEGSDQHRGWFQSSLLTYIAHQTTINHSAGKGFTAPWRQLVTHGFTLDGTGRKMSKSIGNVTSPEQIMDGSLLPPIKAKKGSKSNPKASPSAPTYDAMGPDALRLWVASSDYTKDVLVGSEVLNSVAQRLKKLRITFKWLSGVLQDYEPAKEPVPSPIDDAVVDQIAIHQLNKTVDAVHAAYKEYNFSKGVDILAQYVTQNLSAFYLETMKDRMYAGEDVSRMSAQPILCQIYVQLLRMLSPITPLLVEEAYDYLPQQIRDHTPHPMRQVWSSSDSQNDTGSYDQDLDSQVLYLQKMNNAVKGLQEDAREKKLLGSGLESSVQFIIPHDAHDSALQLLRPEPPIHKHAHLEKMLVVSGVEVEFPSEVSLQEPQGGEWGLKAPLDVGSRSQTPGWVVLQPPTGHKCPRCWKYDAPREDHVCSRCEEIVSKLPSEETQ